MTKEVEEYLLERLEQSVVVIVPHKPVSSYTFRSKEEVDEWINKRDSLLLASFSEFDWGDNNVYTCPTCKNTEHSEDALFCKICGRRNDS